MIMGAASLVCGAAVGSVYHLWPRAAGAQSRQRNLKDSFCEAGDINCQIYGSRFPKGAKIGDLSFVILSLLTTYGRFEPHEEG